MNQVPKDIANAAINAAVEDATALLNKDSVRLEWCLDILAGEDSDRADRKALRLGAALMLGLDGRDAIDRAMADV